MTFAIHELTRLLTPETTVTGIVTVTKKDGRVTVATRTGGITARTVSAMAVGQRVIVRSGWADHAPVASAVYPV